MLYYPGFELRLLIGRRERGRATIINGMDQQYIDRRFFNVPVVDKISLENRPRGCVSLSPGGWCLLSYHPVW